MASLSEATTVTLSPRVEIQEECHSCGGVAEVDFESESGNIYPVCGVCDAHLRDTMLSLNDADEMHGECQDCRTREATLEFWHLDGRRFNLCHGCWDSADHEEDYMVFCECAEPVMHGEHYRGIRCETCRLAVRSQVVVDDLQQQADADPGDDQRGYDWGEEEAGDFRAEEDEDDDDEGPWDRDFFASSMADMRLDGTYALMTRGY